MKFLKSGKQFFVLMALIAALLLVLPALSTIGATPALAQSQKLDTSPLKIITARGTFEFTVEVADDPKEQEIGLMNRPQMDKTSGMLFDFGRKKIVNMWMKNTMIPLDMVFTDDSGTVVSVSENAVPQSLDIISSVVPASFVLEINGGMAKFIGIKVGDKLVHAIYNKQPIE